MMTYLWLRCPPLLLPNDLYFTSEGPHLNSILALKIIAQLPSVNDKGSIILKQHIPNIVPLSRCTSQFLLRMDCPCLLIASEWV